MLSLSSISLIPRAIKAKSEPVLGLANKLKQGFLNLSTAQKLYSLAFVILCFGDQLGWVALLSVIAMGLEFWPLFERVWHSLAGKAVLLLFYAIIANFALSTSAAIVNEVVGVSASHLNYTHNFALLLYIPAWFVVMTALVLLAMQIIIPFYLLLLLMLKPLGITAFRFTQHDRFRKSTAFVRLILAAIVLYHLFLLIDVEHVVDMPDGGIVEIAGVEVLNMNASPTRQLGDSLEAAAKDQVSDVLNLKTVETTETPILTAAAKKEVVKEELEQLNLERNYAIVRGFYQQKVREMIAIFAFNLEADSRSRCQKAKDSSVVELNDYEILEITKDKEAKFGYHFEVKKCVSVAFPLR